MNAFPAALAARRASVGPLKALARTIGGRNLSLLIALGGFLIYLAIATEHYMEWENGKIVILQMTSVGLMSLGTTFLIISGNVDLSVGSNFGLAAVASAMMAKHAHPAVAIAFGIALAAFVGFCNGVLVWRIAISPIIITLGSLTLIKAAVLLLTQGQGIDNVPLSFGSFGQTWPLGVPMSVWILIGVAIVLWSVLARTTVGRHVYAIGGNREAAGLAGLRTRRVVLGLFLVNGALVGLAGTLAASRFGSADPGFGFGYELDVITAVILGGVAFSGGEGGIGGVMLAVALLQVIQSGIIALGIDPYYADIVKGGALIVAVGLDQLVHEQRERFRRLLAMRERRGEAEESETLVVEKPALAGAAEARSAVLAKRQKGGVRQG